MKILSSRFPGALAALVATLLIIPPASAQTNAPKRLLEVSVTKGFRHQSIPAAHRALMEMSTSTGLFTIDQVNTDADMAAKMTPEALKNYDGVIFNCTTGDLPLPDKQAFLDWIKSGKAFIGIHCATDTFHSKPGEVDPYIDMIGAEFTFHVVTNNFVLTVEDTNHPSTRHLGATWTVSRDEIFVLQKDFSREKVHMLLSVSPATAAAIGGLMKAEQRPAPGQTAYYPISWCKKYGQGNVFYCALGDIGSLWRNENFRQHYLGGIKWALGLEPGDATPQKKAAGM